MSYKKMTIVDIVKAIDAKQVYLPSLQRKFVWRKSQIQLLFDSLMRNYPVGTFLFWKLRRGNAANYVFYEFLTEYDERTPYNRRKTGVFLHEEILGVLDGQQRLSSMYIGLMGTHTEKTPYRHISNPDAYEKTSLYLNLFSLPYVVNDQNHLQISDEKDFEFRFLTEARARAGGLRKVEGADVSAESDEPMLWLKVGDVLGWPSGPDFYQLVDDMLSSLTSEAHRLYFVANRRKVLAGIELLHRRIVQDELINYFEIAKDDLEDILKIFVRVNSGGTVLSKTDLLFSTIVATWDDGREQIEDLLKIINAKGDGFNFSNEYLMRCCLVLSDGPVLYKVNSFRAENVEAIRQAWPMIAEAIKKTVDLLVEFGFSNEVLVSQNATIILAYYLYKGGSQTAEAKKGMRKYLLHALLQGIYGSSQENLINALRNAFRKEKIDPAGKISFERRFDNFSFNDVLAIPLPQQKTLKVNQQDLERFLQFKKGPGSFLVLAMLYPHLRYSDVTFHQDHIHPASRFTPDQFQALGIPEQEQKSWLERRDSVPNLQLMNGKLNSSKNATPFQTWFDALDAASGTAFKKENYLPENIDLGFSEFLTFFEARKAKLREALSKELALSYDGAAEQSMEWDEPDDIAALESDQE